LDTVSHENRNLRVEVHKCPNCGAQVEIFSDELKVKCHRCGSKVYREETPSCIEWCATARECLGEERWQELMGDRNIIKRQAGDDDQSIEKNG
jgi:DNA-directed RNA polymerase subunit RPC12/RpoP